MLSNKKTLFLFLKFNLIAIICFYLYFVNILEIHAYEFIEEWKQSDKLLPFNISNSKLYFNDTKAYLVGGSASDIAFNSVFSSELNQSYDYNEWNLVNNIFEHNLYFFPISIYKNFVYSLGGMKYPPPTALDNIYISNKDNPIQPWTLIETKLPNKLSYGSSFVYFNRIYYLGGFLTSGGSEINKNNVYFTDINLDGTLSPNWTETTPLRADQGWNRMETVFTGRKAVVIGGNVGTISNTNLTRKVFQADVNPITGHIREWQETFSLPATSEGYLGYGSMGVAIVGNYIVVAGGNAINPNHVQTNTNYVFYSEIQSDGSIGEWKISEHKLPIKTCCGGFSATKTHLYLTGGFSVELLPAGYHNKSFYASVNTTPYGNTILPVPNFKQFDNRWRWRVYDHATQWTTDPSIYRWGCAVTSAAMILNHYGYPADPQNLNDWLVSQPDGYIRNGLVNWLAISRYSKINSSDGKKLEFIRPNVNDNSLKEQISLQRPSIVKVPGHFVVVKGVENNKFIVNDPASNVFTFLNQVEDYHGGTYSQINTYIKSSTDLSYIMAVIDENNSIGVKNGEDQNINNIEYYEEPIYDTEDDQFLNQEILKVILIPKPTDDEYVIEVKGENGDPYTIDFYLYDTEGNLKMNSYTSLIEDDSEQYLLFKSVDNYSISTTEESNITHSNTMDYIFLLWSNHLITNKGLYESLIHLVGNSDNSYEENKLELSIKLLNNAVTKLNTTKESMISVFYKNVLINNIKALIASIS